MDIKHFNNLDDYHTYLNWLPPQHPMISIMSIEKLISTNRFRESSPPISTDFYTIKLKKIDTGSIIYGRTKYDFKNGCILCISPEQIFSWEKVALLPRGFIITIHKDYLRDTSLEEKIKQYNFFSYSANEALHLSNKEEDAIINIFDFIHREYVNNQDEFSKDIIISHIESLLKYTNRFYKRQFLDRKIINTELSEKFKKILIEYFKNDTFLIHGNPTVQYIADQLQVSPRYLSDMLKSQTGKTAINHIHYFLIEESKNMLLKPLNTVSNVAFNLGFTTPQYFTKLFKQKVGITPKEYQNKR